MKANMKNDRTAIITLVGLAAMTVLTAIKAATSSQLASAALVISGLAFFFIVEGVAKTPDAESGLSFKRFGSDLKKPWVIPLILLLIALTLLELFLDKLLFGSALAEHVVGRVSIMSSKDIPMVLLNQIFVVLGEEIGFRGFFVGKGMKLFPFWPVALVSAAVFALAHLTAGPAAIVACDVAQIFIDALLFALLYRKTGNCLISCIPHFVCNMLGYFLLPIIYGLG